MESKRILPVRSWLAAAALSGALYPVSAASHGPAPEGNRHAVAILDPVDLTSRETSHARGGDPDWGEHLRRCFASRPAWKVVGRDSMRAREDRFGFVSYRGCHEFQCAFDAGNVYAAEFVLFSSLSRLGGAFVYTLNLVHVPSAQTVWSRVGEAGVGEAGNPGANLENAWARLIGRLSPENAPLARGAKLGQVTVLDLSLSRWAPAQAVAERVATHLYATRAFEIMGSREQDELVGALGIDKQAFIPSDSAVFALGGKMGVSHLASVRLIKDRRNALGLELGFYDIAGRRKVKAGRSEDARDIVDVLRFETAFFASLFPIDPDGEESLAPPRRFRISRAAAAAGAATGIVCGILAYRSDLASRRSYGRIADSRSRESALELRGRAELSERQSRVWGAIGLAGLAAGGAFLAFSF